jgi:hypothetical protein
MRRVVPILVGNISLDEVARSDALGWLSSFRMPAGSTTEERMAAAVASLSQDVAYTAAPPESAAESSLAASESPAPAASPEPPAMSDSARNVLDDAVRRAGTYPVDASAVFVSAMRYARDNSMPGVSGALLAALAGRQQEAEDLVARLDAALTIPDPLVPGSPLADVAGTAPLSNLLALAAGCAERVAGHREIHLRHLVAAAVLARDPPLRRELLAALGVTAGELRQITREAARQETTGEPQEAWDALLPAVPLRLLEPFIDTPRDAKRTFNLYRMLRSTRDLSVASAFLGGHRQPGEYQAVATLLAMLAADARLLHHVLDAPPQFDADTPNKTLVAGGLTHRPAEGRWDSFVGDLQPQQVEDRWENQVVGWIPDREVREWQRLAAAAGQTSAQVSLPDLTVFQRWAPSIRRFSYLLSPLNDPGRADRRDGPP